MQAKLCAGKGRRHGQVGHRTVGQDPGRRAASDQGRGDQEGHGQAVPGPPCAREGLRGEAAAARQRDSTDEGGVNQGELRSVRTPKATLSRAASA